MSLTIDEIERLLGSERTARWKSPTMDGTRIGTGTGTVPSGEMPFTHLDHALQTAAVLRQEFPDDIELAVAGLVHDIGHLLPGVGDAQHAEAVPSLCGRRWGTGWPDPWDCTWRPSGISWRAKRPTRGIGRRQRGVPGAPGGTDVRRGAAGVRATTPRPTRPRPPPRRRARQGRWTRGGGTGGVDGARPGARPGALGLGPRQWRSEISPCVSSTAARVGTSSDVRSGRRIAGCRSHCPTSATCPRAHDDGDGHTASPDW